MSTYPGYYLSGDGGYIDEDGYVFVMGRVDDVINVAGHRFSTGEIEEVIGSHPAVAECAVVGIDDDLKGQAPIGFTIQKDGHSLREEELEKELVELVRKEMGAVLFFRKNILVKRLPKTRSGKILRKTIRALFHDKPVITPPTIDDPEILTEIKNRIVERGLNEST